MLVPHDLLTESTPTEREAILLHELAHIRRADYAWNLLARIVQVVYWPNPLVWIVGRCMNATREQACDQMCIHYIGEPRSYVAALLRVAEALVRPQAPVADLAMAGRTGLSQRLASIARGYRSPSCVARYGLRMVIVGTVLTLTAISGSLLPVARAVAATPSQPIIDTSWYGTTNPFDPACTMEVRLDGATACAIGQPVDVAAGFVNALLRKDWPAVDKLVSGRLASRIPADWQHECTAVARMFVHEIRSAVPEPTTRRQAGTLAIQFAVPEAVGTHTGGAYVVVLREFGTQLWSVVAVAPAKADAPLARVHDDLLAWTHGQTPSLDAHTWARN